MPGNKGKGPKGGGRRTQVNPLAARAAEGAQAKRKHGEGWAREGTPQTRVPVGQGAPASRRSEALRAGAALAEACSQRAPRPPAAASKAAPASAFRGLNPGNALSQQAPLVTLVEGQVLEPLNTSSAVSPTWPTDLKN